MCRIGILAPCQVSGARRYTDVENCDFEDFRYALNYLRRSSQILDSSRFVRLGLRTRRKYQRLGTTTGQNNLRQVLEVKFILLASDESLVKLKVRQPEKVHRYALKFDGLPILPALVEFHDTRAKSRRRATEHA